ncbi:hypothetical protein [Treponema pectinovorum]|uniref:hypothetical protein n=1 Tax=Treponema pectinovorum TaxID=164 RepID=UPI0011C8A4CD|nr:hypothetical protein [Treponema pectinovorum]
MKKNVKSLVCTIICFLASFSIFALPGVIHSVQDHSGQFVYYKDYSFDRESYLGIIFYDENTYGLRYFSPANTSIQPIQPKKDVSILFSLDSTKDYVELTGERFLSFITPEDTDIINYLHDMIYELTARRQKVGVIDETFSSKQEYEQFGGEVTINFDSQIPIFNIKNIVNSKNQEIFSLITAGQLVSSDDKSFENFEGLPIKTLDEKHSLKLDKKAKKEQITYSKIEKFVQQINLDTQWQASAENLYMLNDDAILVLDVIELPNENSQTQKKEIINQIKRKFILGTDSSYPYSEILKIETTKDSQKYENIFYNQGSNSFTKDFKILTKLDQNHFAFLTLTVFQGAYGKNSKYFESILKSYSAK